MATQVIRGVVAGAVRDLGQYHGLALVAEHGFPNRSRNELSSRDYVHDVAGRLILAVWRSDGSGMGCFDLWD